MVQSSMRFLKNKKSKKPTVKPSVHVALLRIVNEHFATDLTYDLSHFDFEEMQGVIEYIEAIQELKDTDNVGEMWEEAEEYEEDE